MTYELGVDLGTTFTAAAISRDGRVEVVTLGVTSPALPTIVFAREDGTVLVGEAAARRGATEPERLAREFKRRLGDPAPIVLGGVPYSPERLLGDVLRAVLTVVTEREGEPPSRVVLTHPATYGPFKLDMMAAVARSAGLDPAITVFVSEPEAAAINYATRQRVEVGETVAVYDFGGGTFDAAVVRRSVNGFELIGRPEGIDRFGGIDVDAAILAHVDDALDGVPSSADEQDPAVRAALVRLRDDCRAAKESLSSDTDASVSVLLPSVHTQVRMTRRELESMIRPRIKETVDVLERAVRSADLEMSDVTRVLLVGGSSRMPLVAEMVAERTGRPVANDAHPKLAIAAGAAAWSAFGGRGQQVMAPPPEPMPAPVVSSPPTGFAGPPPLPAAGVAPPRRRRTAMWVVLAFVAVLAVVGAALAVSGGDDGGDRTSTSTPDSTGVSTATGVTTGSSSAETVATFDPACPAADGSSPRQTSFAQAPPMCIDPSKSFVATVETNLGSLQIQLDAQAAPITVNNFVFLSRFHFFDGTPCHRIIGGFVVQCGDPTGTGTGGPGYTFEDEPPVDGYRIGDLAMAKTSEPDTNGSQFFFITGADGTQLPLEYSRFGRVTDGLDSTLPALDAEADPGADNGVPPRHPVTIVRVTISET